MTDLLDIAPATAYDVVRTSDGRRVKVRGLRSNDIAAIVTRFPHLIAAVAAAGDNLVFLVGALGVATGPVIAAGCDQLGNEQQEAAADRFLFEDQVKLLKAIFWLTFPNGLSSLMDTMATLAEPKKPMIKVRSKTSPSVSPDSSDTVSHQTMQ